MAATTVERYLLIQQMSLLVPELDNRVRSHNPLLVGSVKTDRCITKCVTPLHHTFIHMGMRHRQTRNTERDSGDGRRAPTEEDIEHPSRMDNDLAEAKRAPVPFDYRRAGNRALLSMGVVH